MSGIPSGSGTEVLKRATADGVVNSYNKILDGEADHIYTILSMVVFAHTTASFEITMNPSAGTKIWLMSAVSIPGNGTFVLNDKIVLSGTDELEIKTSTGSVDVVLSYIEQDWS